MIFVFGSWIIHHVEKTSEIIFYFCVSEDGGENLKICVPLYEASIRQSWYGLLSLKIKIQPFTLRQLQKTRELMEDFVENLVSLMEKEDLELQNTTWNLKISLTSIRSISHNENVKMVKIMVNATMRVIV